MGDIQRIIEFIDHYLERTGEPYVTPPEAGAALDAAWILKDRPERSGLPLRKLLRMKQIPHAYQEPAGKHGRWGIPHSSPGRRAE